MESDRLHHHPPRRLFQIREFVGSSTVGETILLRAFFKSFNSHKDNQKFRDESIFILRNYLVTGALSSDPRFQLFYWSQIITAPAHVLSIYKRAAKWGLFLVSKELKLLDGLPSGEASLEERLDSI